MSKLAQAIVEAARRELARKNFFDFVTYTKPDFETSWHHEVICRELDDWIAGANPRLILNAPPRHGKSELASRRLPAFIFGRDPDAEIIATSYSSDLAQRMNRDVQRIMDGEEYRKVFPNTALFGANIRTVAKGTYLRNSDIFEIVGHSGIYRAAGVGGGITGMGAKYAIIDDPLKNRQDANSQQIRDTVWDWYASTLYTRLAPGGRILIIMTRWHEDDIVGRMLERQGQEGGDHWRVVSFPAVCEEGREDAHPDDPRREGDALWPTRYDDGALVRIKVTLGSYEWASLYQQRPSPSEGAIFLRDWWQYWLELPPLHRFDNIIQSWDCTFKDHAETDYVVGQVWASKGADRYLLDQARGRMDFPSTIKAVKKMKNKWPATSAILIEDKANGPAVISTLKHDVPGLIAVNPEGGKVVRAQAVTAQIEAGNVYIPSPEKCAWVGDFIEECAAFPNGRNDDQVDAMTQALTRLRGDSGIEIWKKLAIG